MKKSILQLEPFKSAVPNTYRTVFKTRHGRLVFMALVVYGTRTGRACVYDT